MNGTHFKKPENTINEADFDKHMFTFSLGLAQTTQ